ncbi:MAG: hypothetical protein ACON4P_00190 [Candidatus Puniceispirillales bacterium]
MNAKAIDQTSNRFTEEAAFLHGMTLDEASFPNNPLTEERLKAARPEGLLCTEESQNNAQKTAYRCTSGRRNPCRAAQQQQDRGF